MKSNMRILSLSNTYFGTYSATSNITNTSYDLIKNNIQRLNKDKLNYWLASCAIITSLFLTNKFTTHNESEEETTILNWSGTHQIKPKHYHEPETLEELKEILNHCIKHKIKLRPVGSALSPNGLSFNDIGMVNLVNLDKILGVDMENMTVTVQAGARVSQVSTIHVL